MLLIQFLVVLAAIIIGARLGGIGLGVMGGVGLLILTFVFGLQPTTPPVDVMLMIAAVISAASCMQAAGGLEYMVKLAERILRKNPSRVTILSPLVTYLFTFVAGTGHIAYSVLPVIAEVARETRIRPERRWVSLSSLRSRPLRPVPSRLLPWRCWGCCRARISPCSIS